MSDITLIPRISEKALSNPQGQGQKGQVVVFDVPVSVNKQLIAEAVKAQFKVEVLNVTTLLAKGKAVRTVRKRSKAIDGRRKTIKKAYVTLGKDSRIAILEEPKEKPKKGISK